MRGINFLLFFSIILLANYSFSQATGYQFDATLNGQTITTCNGVLFDSHGQGPGGYANNEDYVVTFCPNVGSPNFSITFNAFFLDVTDDNPDPILENVDYMYVYDGPTTGAPLIGQYSGTQLLGLPIIPGAGNASKCITLRFVSNSVGQGNFSASISCSIPCVPPTAAGGIVDGITQDSIRVCVDEVVQFEDLGSFGANGMNIQSYTWDFMDGNTATGANVSHSFDIPGYYKVTLVVQDNNPDNVCKSTNPVELKVLVGTIPTFQNFPNDTTICIGETLNYTLDPSTYQVEWNGFPTSNTISDGCLSDNLLGVPQNVDLMQSSFTIGSTITNINQIESICLDMEHSFIGDLIISVRCPNGQICILHQQGGGGLDLGVPVISPDVDCNDPTTLGTTETYCFTPTATETWVDFDNNNPGSTQLAPGDYASIQPLSNLIGCPTNGVWTISVVDNWGGDDGNLVGFGLNLDPSLYQDMPTFEPVIGVGADSSFWQLPSQYASATTNDGNGISIAPATGGVYQYVYELTDNFGCQYDTTLTVTVQANPTLSIGNDTIICGNSTLTMNPVITGASSNCEYTIYFTDTFGDGWNGNTISIICNGVTTSYTMDTGSSDSITFSVPSGANVTATFNADGAFVNECVYNIKDEAGNIVADQPGPLSVAVTDQFVSNCAGDWIYSWTPANIMDDATIETPQATLNSTQTISFTIYPVGHPLCIVTDSCSVIIPNPVNAGNDTTITICDGLFPLNLITFLPGADLNGEWKNQAGQVVTMPISASIGSGQYSYTVVNSICTDRATVTLNIISTSITNTQITDVNCFGGSNGSVTITGNNFNQYSLNNGAFVNTTSPFTINNLSAGLYTLTLKGNNGCLLNSTFVISQPLPLNITQINNDINICRGDSVVLHAVGTGGSSNYTYTWLHDGLPIGQGQNMTVFPYNLTNEYCVVLTEACGSQPDTACFTVTTSNEIDPIFIPNHFEGCLPLIVNFDNQSTFSNDILKIKFTYGDGSVETFVKNQSINHVYTKLGVFDVEVEITSIYGCVYTKKYNNYIETFDNPIADFVINPNPVNIHHPDVELKSTSSADVIKYTWTIPFGEPNEAITPVVSVHYPYDVIANYEVTLVVTNANQCTDTAINYVIVNNEVLCYAPNSFTPDGDQFNQTWLPIVSGIDILGYNLKIFNRWGEIIWESNDHTVPWDGTYNGKIVQSGAYNWVMTCGDLQNDAKLKFNGSVNVLK